MAETLSTLSIVSFVIATICLALAIFLWFYLKIPRVIGDLTGSTARKSIARMRATNERTGNKNYRESKTNLERGKLTETESSFTDKSKQTKSSKKSKAGQNQRVETGILVDNKAHKYESDTTGLLIDEEATAPLNKEIPRYAKRSGGKKLTMIEEIMVIHTNEVI